MSFALLEQGLGKLFDKAENSLVADLGEGGDFFITVFEKLVDISKK